MVFSAQDLLTPLVFLVIAWTLPWKGVALWRAARRGDKWWFVGFLLVNLLAIPEILYIFIFSKRKSLMQELPAQK